MKSFKKLYADFSVKEKENFLSLKPEEMLMFARENECDTNIEEISSLLNSTTPFHNDLSYEELNTASGGIIKMSTDDAYYVFTGDYDKECDYNNMYSCPYRDRTLHLGSWLRWYDKSKLLTNLSSNPWTNIPNNQDNKYPTDIKTNLPR